MLCSFELYLSIFYRILFQKVQQNVLKKALKDATEQYEAEVTLLRQELKSSNESLARAKEYSASFVESTFETSAEISQMEKDASKWKNKCREIARRFKQHRECSAKLSTELEDQAEVLKTKEQEIQMADKMVTKWREAVKILEQELQHAQNSQSPDASMIEAMEILKADNESLTNTLDSTRAKLKEVVRRYKIQAEKLRHLQQ